MAKPSRLKARHHWTEWTDSFTAWVVRAGKHAHGAMIPTPSAWAPRLVPCSLRAACSVPRAACVSLTPELAPTRLEPSTDQ
ncbi:hypothetical protein ACRE_087940 [Hapsidospora chrysogenum ATCC 11550]|uniref:Uncharacterized protein n=1 Tax=Hapsidospora chrysogenum (strain ATCC 11550 / CBS 779.69 / DSM 880 / IAM 14645 / JCM 23072 / IMI 49137) TaxID=857340 RepID=A0A086STS9_HAPC1|nr:hypothetical protein ACRE_087940 [Hapsidospora chrysogenum ATCC 11550]